MHVQICEICDRCEQGVTKPFIGKCTDGNRYYIKGNYAGRKALISEWIAGRIAGELGLPVPEIKIIDIPREIGLFGIREDSHDLGTDPAFGSQEQPGIMEVPFSFISRLDPRLRARILLFDWWVMNGDRTLSEYTGNPNMLFSPDKKTIWIIDHNLAFQEDGCIRIFSDHIFANSTVEWTTEFKEIQIPTMKRIVNNVPTFWNELPDEWKEYDCGLDLNMVTTILSRFLVDPDSFWRIR